MKVLAVDIGTGTQDILLFDARLDMENAYKMVLPAPTMIVHRRLRQATRDHVPVFLSGYTMGGGPSQWAAEDHANAGLPIFATPQAARSFNDDLTAVEAMGIRVISEDEGRRLPENTVRLELRDFDLPSIRSALHPFGVRLDDLSAVAVAVFDHGAAPPDVSDRQFRFDYLDERIRIAEQRPGTNPLSAFAFRSGEIPPIMTRLQAVADSTGELPCPLVVMDTAPAAVLGATFDPQIAAQERVLICNIGNFHTLAFRLGPDGIEGVFEHHTGLLVQTQLEGLIRSLAGGSLKHEDVFGNHGHGALIYSDVPLEIDHHNRLAVTGPRRGMLQGSELTPHFAVPFGDMMISGCFGLVAAAADLLPSLREQVITAMRTPTGVGKPPWEA